MKRSFKIATKIWLSFSIMVAGYLILVLLSVDFGKQMKTRLSSISEDFIPVTNLSKEALTAFNEQIQLYNDAVMMGEKSLVESAQAHANRARNALETILKLKGLDPQKKAEVNGILARLNEFTAVAQVTYVDLCSAFENKGGETKVTPANMNKTLEDQAITLAQQTLWRREWVGVRYL